LPALVAFISGKNARKWSERTPEERKSAVIQQLFYWFKTDLALSPTGYYEHDWTTEEFSRGCYMNLMSPGSLSECSKYLREPVGRIHWAGSETARRWMAYMEGAAESGCRVANEVLERLHKEGIFKGKL